MTDLNVLIVGGGIQGAGLLHDLASRRVGGVHLLEKSRLAAGTSSRSTKLVHGGLRYLEHLGQWALVSDALHERSTLLRLLKGIVQPIPFVLPNFEGGRPSWMVKLGLTLYDSLGGDSGLPASRFLSLDEIETYAPYLKKDLFGKQIKSGFLYYDAQMLDDVIVRVAAEAAVHLGASYEENSEVEEVTETQSGFRVTVNTNGIRRVLTTKFLINAAGAWCNANLLKWGFRPNISCILNVGTHLVFDQGALPYKPSEHAATLLQNTDGRVVFFIPWNGKWLLGTTESIFTGVPENIRAPQHDIDYLYAAASPYIEGLNAEKLLPTEVFCGLRTMPIHSKGKNRQKEILESHRKDPFSSPFYITKFAKNISGLSRELVVDEVVPRLISIYGGKYTTYRSHAEKLGGKISRSLGVGGTSGTASKESWFLQELLLSKPEIFQSHPALRQL